MTEEEEESTSILALLLEIDRKVKEISQNNTSDESSSSHEIYFLINNNNTSKKRGKPAGNENINQEVHDRTKFDNLLTKIQVHFLSFVIAFCNAAFNKEYKCSKDSFKNINYKNKANVKSSYISKLKNSTIKDLLKMDISTKFTTLKKSNNKDLLEKIESSSPILNELFEMKYLDLFRYYYNQKKPLDKIVYNNIVVDLSGNKECKSFYHLLEKNKNLRTLLIGIAEEQYLQTKMAKKDCF